VNGAPAPVVEARGVEKAYGSVQALEAADFAVYPGETVAVVGDNGAGKSTLIKILCGAVQPDDGVVSVGGEEVRFASPRDARVRGISVVYQDLALVDGFDVAHNVFLGRVPSRWLRVDRKRMARETRRVLGELTVELPSVRTPVRFLSGGQRQAVAIARAVHQGGQLLIMDEPTAALSLQEVDNLFATVRRLHDRGVAVLFISHRLEEVSEIADVVTVLRDGRHVATRPAAELSHGEMIRLMVGRSLEALFPKEDAEIGEPVFRAEGLTRRGFFSRVSFELRRGEIVGLAGFVGSGRTEIARAVFGIDRLDAGALWIEGRRFSPRSPRAALRRGVAYLPEDRLRQGLVQPMSVERNTSMAVLPALAPGGILRPWRERRLARTFMERLRIKATSPAQVVRSLSGGNQQKVVLAKWLAAHPRILILDEPTHGVDVGTKADVHRTISHLAAQGLAILLISSELPEILAMSDRILVLREGRLVAEFSREEATQERIVQAAAGVVEAA
jgi:rhamnose transport system ATP-binding protein